MIDTEKFDFFELKDILKRISARWSNLKGVRQINRFCPFVYLHNLDENKLKDIKSDLINDGYLIEDGYYYKGCDFDAKLILREVVEIESPYRTHLKIINNLDDFENLKKENIPNKYVYQMYQSEPFLEIDESYDIYIKNLECLQEIVCGK